MAKKNRRTLRTTCTDHFTTLLVLSKSKKNCKVLKSKTTVDFEGAFQYLKEQNIQGLLSCDDPNTVVEKLVKILSESLENNTSVIKIPKSKRVIKPWMTPGLLKCIKNRNQLQKQWLSDPNSEIKKITYTRYRNHCNNLLKKLKRKHERELLANSIDNNKLLWKNVKQITYTNKTKK